MRIIIRVRGEPEVHRERIEALGGHVIRVFKLIPGLAVEASQDVIDVIKREPWVATIEPDRDVTTQE